MILTKHSIREVAILKNQLISLRKIIDKINELELNEAYNSALDDIRYFVNKFVKAEMLSEKFKKDTSYNSEFAYYLLNEDYSDHKVGSIVSLCRSLIENGIDKDDVMKFISYTINLSYIEDFLKNPNYKTIDKGEGNTSDITLETPLMEAYFKNTSDVNIYRNIVDGCNFDNFIKFDSYSSVYSRLKGNYEWQISKDKSEYLKYYLNNNPNAGVFIQTTKNTHTQIPLGKVAISKEYEDRVQFLTHQFVVEDNTVQELDTDIQSLVSQLKERQEYALNVAKVSTYYSDGVDVYKMLSRISKASKVAYHTNGNNIEKGLTYKLIFNTAQNKIFYADSIQLEQCLSLLYANGTDKVDIYFDSVDNKLVLRGKDVERQISVSKGSGDSMFDVTETTYETKSFPSYSIIEQQSVNDITNVIGVEYIEFYDENITFKQKYDILNIAKRMPISLPNEFIEDYSNVASNYDIQVAFGNSSSKSNDEKREFVIDLMNEYLSSYTNLREIDKGIFERVVKIKPIWANKDYVYRVEETYWRYNKDITVDELIAYFVSKQDSVNYRLLCLKILGFDYWLFYDSLVDYLIEDRKLFISKIKLDEDAVDLDIEYLDYAQFVSSNIYKRQDLIGNNDYSKSVLKYLGESANSIIDKANSVIENAVEDRFVLDINPKGVGLKPEDKASLTLDLDIHNPIFYNSSFVFNKLKYSRIIAEIPYDNALSTSRNTDNNILNIKTKTQGDSRDFRYGHLQLFDAYIRKANIKNDILISGDKDNLPDEIRDGYIVPLQTSRYIAKYIMPNYSIKLGDTRVSLNLSSSSIGDNFTRTSIFNFTENDLNTLKSLDIIQDTDPKKITDAESKEFYKNILINFKERAWEIKKEGRRLFNKWLREEVDNVSQQEISKIWNRRYNNYAKPNLNKQPIFVTHSVLFGKKDKPFKFNLLPTQVDGVRHTTTRDNCGLLLHEVGFGKAQLMTSKVLTPNGFVEMKDISIGDYVIGRDGRPTKVKGVYPQGKIECSKVTFNDGASVEVSDNHLWKVQTINYRGKYKDKWDVLETKELLNKGLYNKRNDYQFSIPMVEPVHFNDRKLPINPYLLGYLLGNGTFSGASVGFSCADEDIVSRIKSIIPSNLSVKKQKGDNVDYRISKGLTYGTNEIVRAVKELGLSGTHSYSKFIPDIYKVNSVDNRIELLRGLMDADGTIQKTKGNGNSSIYSTTSLQLSEDIRFLVESLGGTVSINTKIPKYTYNGEKKIGRLCYNITIRLPKDIVPFWVNRKVDAHIPKTKYQPIRFISSIESIGKHEAQCIEVEDPEHLYCCDNFIVTHNTTTSIVAISQLFNTGEGKRALFIVPNSVYDKFEEEIKGTDLKYGILPNVNLIKLDNGILDSGKDENGLLLRDRLKNYTEIELEAIENIEAFIKEVPKIINSLSKGRIMFNKEEDFDNDSSIDTLIDLLEKDIKKYIPNYDNIQVLKDRIQYSRNIYAEVNDKYNIEKVKLDNILSDPKKKEKEQDKAREEIVKKAITLSNSFNKKIEEYFKFVKNAVSDDLGVYKPDVLKPNTILLAKHNIVQRLRPSAESVQKAVNFKLGYAMPNKDEIIDEGLAQDKWTSYYKGKGSYASGYSIQKNVLSFDKLLVDTLVVDEIHNFNNIVGRILPKGIATKNMPASSPRMKYPEELNEMVFTKKVDRSLSDNNGYYVTNLPVLEDRSRAGNSQEYRDIRKANTWKSANKNKLNLSALCFDIQFKNPKSKNVYLLSATPFTDHPIQVMSVLGMANYEFMINSGINNGWDFWTNYVSEIYKWGIRHDETFGLFVEIDGYYNDKALSNLITNIANVKITDEKIEANRPKKAIIPQNKEQKYLVRVNNEVKTFSSRDIAEKYAQDNNSAVEENIAQTYSMSKNQFDELEDVMSKIVLSDAQKEMKRILTDYLKDDNDTTEIYDLFPMEVPEVVSLSDETDLDEIIKDIKKKADAFKKQDTPLEAEALVEELNDLFLEYPDSKKIVNAISYINRNILDISEAEEDEEDTKGQEIKVGNIQDVDKRRGAKAISVQTANESLVVSPYLLGVGYKGLGKNLLLPDLTEDPAKVFVENSPKLLYTAKCIGETIKYQQEQVDKGLLSKVGGQVVYFNKFNFRYAGKEYNAFKLFAEYLVRFIDGVYDDKTEGGEYKDIAIITGLTRDEDKTKSNGKKGKNRKEIVTTRGKIAIKDSFNNGEIKVLIGSKAIKEGIDLQGNSTTLYILQQEFSPTVSMQLEGRIWRQGNPYDVVRIVYVLAMNSIDSFIYDKLNKKVSSIKNMLERGTYEMNTTQFSIDTKERLIELTDDVENLTEMEYSDRIGDLKRQDDILATRIRILTDIAENYDIAKSSISNSLEYIAKLYNGLKEVEDDIYKEDIEKEINRERKSIASSQKRDLLDKHNKDYEDLSDKEKEKFKPKALTKEQKESMTKDEIKEYAKKQGTAKSNYLASRKSEIEAIQPVLATENDIQSVFDKDVKEGKFKNRFALETPINVDMPFESVKNIIATVNKLYVNNAMINQERLLASMDFKDQDDYFKEEKGKTARFLKKWQECGWALKMNDSDTNYSVVEDNNKFYSKLIGGYYGARTLEAFVRFTKEVSDGKNADVIMNYQRYVSSNNKTINDIDDIIQKTSLDKQKNAERLTNPEMFKQEIREGWQKIIEERYENEDYTIESAVETFKESNKLLKIR